MLDLTLPLTTGTVMDLQGKRKFTLKGQLPQDGLCDLYHGVFDGPSIARSAPTAEVVPNRYAALMDDADDRIEGEPALLKVTRGPNQDLTENEPKVLQILVAPGDNPNNGFARHIPHLMVEPFRLNALVAYMTPYFGDEYVLLREILTLCPDGIDFRDMVWMFKRGLAGLGYAHSRGVIHSAIIPPHIMVHPTEHGAKIVNWSYAVSDQKSSVKAVIPAWRDYYPPEIFEKQFPTPATDLYMLAKCAVALVGGSVKDNTMPDSVPKEIQEFLLRALNPVQSQRPYNAWDWHEEFDKVLFKLVGEPKYRALILPGT